MRVLTPALVILVVLLSGCTAVTPAQTGVTAEDIITLKHGSVLREVESLYKRNYEPFYTITAMQEQLLQESASKMYSATLLLRVTKVLSANQPEDLPLVRGVLDELHLQAYPYNKNIAEKISLVRSANPDMGAEQARSIVNYLDDLYSELGKYLKQPYEAFLFLYVTASVSTTGSIVPGTINVLAEQPHYERIPLRDFRPLSAQHMYAEGKNIAYSLREGKYRTGEPVYDRWKVVEYADRYSTNATITCPGTKVYSATQTWNNEAWPYYELLCANDCADFASQALNYAGLRPEPGKWQRLKDGANGWAWTSSSGLRRYLVQQKRYARLVLPYQVGAGGLIITSKGHTMVVVRNDTVEILTDAHTNDRHHEPILPNPDWYFINP